MNDNPKSQPPNELKETLARRIAKAGEVDFVVKQLRSAKNYQKPPHIDL